MFNKKVFYFLLILLVSFSFYTIVNGVDQRTDTTEDGTEIPTVSSPPPTTLPNPLGDISEPEEFIGKIINTLFSVVGSLALLMFIYGGLTWMTSSGSQEKVKKGRDIIIWAAIGLVIIFTSYALVRFLIVGVGA